MSICISQKDYKQLLKETRQVKEVFDTLKESFYEAINHKEEELAGDDQENRRMTRSLIKYEGMNLEESKYLDEALTVPEMFRDGETADNKTRQRRFVAELGAFMAGIGAYPNYKNIQKFKENIQVLHEENKKQDEAIGILARFLTIVDTRVRIHTKMLNNINVPLTQLQYRLMGSIYIISISVLHHLCIKGCRLCNDQVIIWINSSHSAKEPTIKPEVAISLYQAIGQEFPSERQMKRYLSKMKKVKEIKKIPEDSQGINTDTA